MKVWAVRESMTHEYDDVHCLWDSEEGAVKHMRELMADDVDYPEHHDYEVREMEILT